MPVISTNTAANSALRYLNINSDDQSSSVSKIASGSRITKASDDAAGLAVGTSLLSDVTVLTQSATNASHGSSILQTADGGMSSISDIVQRMRSLATQSLSGSVTNTERIGNSNAPQSPTTRPQPAKTGQDGTSAAVRSWLRRPFGPSRRFPWGSSGLDL
jgi:hypothetical protein